MKIWTSEHTFHHPWETVVKAAWRKYPNPMNPSVVGLDVVDRFVDKDGILRSHRLMSTKWGIPDWAAKILGRDRICYASEHSEVDPKKRMMTLRSRNLTFCNLITIDEQLIYSPHPQDPNKTRLTQEAVVTVEGIPLSSYMENVVTDTISTNANKGRQAMEWVIGKITGEANDLKQEAQKAVDNMIPHTRPSM
ncbi:hypothetical protein CHS0354_008704 [Potamilus streckersoni]|uniref:PRELI/MSF1 domain-containing protein n=1 Tax=Potamilus streckersoni TaxID=2493646 RepID=A0AAE0TI45_9BIVA|nr:hypothetical protein CHS0354_008704 [Potamilus streckersoni]